jgi:malate permease and related proteins
MEQLALIVACLALGVALRASGRLPDNAGTILGGWVINVALPAAVFRNFHQLTINSDWWLAAATPWIGAVFAIAVFVPLCRALRWSRERAGALVLVGGWGNTSFVGLPAIDALAGHKWLGLGIVIDLCGSYLALSTLGVAIASFASSNQFDWRAVVKRIATFPPLLAIVIAFATNDLGRPALLTQIIDTLAQTMTPLAVAAVGYALRLDHVRGRLAPLGLGLFFRLLIAPLALVLMYIALGKAGDPVAKVAMLEMTMPPMLGASIIAMDHKLEPELVALVIGVGVPLSLLTTYALWLLIAGL